LPSVPHVQADLSYKMWEFWGALGLLSSAAKVVASLSHFLLVWNLLSLNERVLRCFSNFNCKARKYFLSLNSSTLSSSTCLKIQVCFKRKIMQDKEVASIRIDPNLVKAVTYTEVFKAV
jgi:hypothetical protein